jgi:hypothetical protein
MVSSRAWFALAVAGVLGLLYIGHELHRSDDAAWQLPAGNTAMAQERGKDGGLFFRPTASSGDIGSSIAKVPGGWFVVAYETRLFGGSGNGGGMGITFLPDPEHKWDGKSLK